MRCTVPVPMPSDLATRKLMASRSQQSRYLSVAGRDRDQTRHPPFAERALRNIWPRSCGSLGLNVGGADHFAPLLGLICDELGEVGGRARQRRTTHIGKPRLEGGVGKRGVDLLVERADDLSGCASRHADTVPSACLVTWYEIVHGGDFG